MEHTNDLFQENIHGWESWGRIFQSVPAFRRLAARIFEQAGLPFEELGNCTPGTNAVFTSGGFILKIFVPVESGFDSSSDFQTELFGLMRAGQLGIPAPRLAAQGSLRDRYLFRYLILERISGKSFGQCRKDMSPGKKYAFGKQLREICDRMNTPCEPFNHREWRRMGSQTSRWEPFSPMLLAERAQFTQHYPDGEIVYVHGDLNEDNLLFDGQGGIRLIDFADGLLAPVAYEHALIASELFRFDVPFLNGFFGDFNLNQLTELCLSGLLLHDFGGNVLQGFLGDVSDIFSLEDLRNRLRRHLRIELEKK